MKLFHTYLYDLFFILPSFFSYLRHYIKIFFQVFFLRNTSIWYLEQLKNQTKTVKHRVWNHNETLIAWFGLLSRLQQHLIKILFCNLSQDINNLIYYQQLAFCRSLALYKMVQEDVLHLFKIFRKQYPKYLFNIISTSMRPYKTRNANIPQFKVKHNFFRNSFFPSVVIEWNKRDGNICNSENLNIFKKKLSKFIRTS